MTSLVMTLISPGILTTRITINKGIVNKGKYWIFEKNKGTPVSYFGDLKGTHKGFQYSISPFFDKIQLKVAESLQTIFEN